jgi:hypothetical protein
MLTPTSGQFVQRKNRWPNGKQELLQESDFGRVDADLDSCPGRVDR